MKDFQKQFKEREDEFDRDFERAKRWGLVMGIFSLIMSLVGIGFFVWVVLMVMRWLGII
jgi:hypothetical protein